MPINLAISNIAWESKEDYEVFELMNHFGVSRLEASPYRDDPSNSHDHLKSMIATAKQSSIKTVAFQALLYGHSGLKLFGSPKQRVGLRDHFFSLIELASDLGVGTLIFGSPSSKLRGELAYDEALKIAVDFFGEIAEQASLKDVVICVEPTPAIYGADFIRDTAEATTLISLVKSQNLALNFDIGAMTSNKEDITDAIQKFASYIGHVHISEPHLTQIEPNMILHQQIAKALMAISYDKTVSIEMTGLKYDKIKSIGDTLSFVAEAYHD